MFKTDEDIRYCKNCKCETNQIFYSSGHERDSSYDYWKCTMCDDYKFIKDE